MVYIEKILPFLWANSIVFHFHSGTPVFPVQFDTSSQCHFLGSLKTLKVLGFPLVHPFLKNNLVSSDYIQHI